MVHSSYDTRTESPPLGDFERHTTGIGSKLIKKQGWEEEGLGKNLDGIIDVPKPPSIGTGRQGLGFLTNNEGRSQPPRKKAKRPKSCRV